MQKLYCMVGNSACPYPAFYEEIKYETIKYFKNNTKAEKDKILEVILIFLQISFTGRFSDNYNFTRHHGLVQLTDSLWEMFHATTKAQLAEDKF